MTDDEKSGVWHFTHDEVGGVDEISLAFIRITGGDVSDKRSPVRQSERLVRVDEWRGLHTSQVEVVINHIEAVGWDAVVD